MKTRILLLAMPLALATVPAVAQDAGARAFQVCAACHSVGDTDTLQGPSLKGIVGRKVASRHGFKYSDAMKKFAASHLVWTEELLDSYIKNANEVVPGTAMGMAPTIRKAKRREAIIGYLKTQK